jgi:uncharacterized membrane protein YfcA
MPENIPLLYYFVAVSASLIAGIINTLAGNGSSLTLAVLMHLIGIPAKEANATIRVGVFATSISALPTFLKNGNVHVKRDILVVISMTLGAILGIFLVLWIDNHTFKEIFKYLFVVMLFLSFVNTKSWFKKTEEQRRLPAYIIIPLYFLLGLYGGFVQMGLGVFFIFVTVLGARYNIIDAGALRTFCVSLYTPIAIIIFALSGLIHWQFAAIMAIGEGTGGYLGARFATTNPKAGIWAHRLLIVVLVVAIITSFWPK